MINLLDKYRSTELPEDKYKLIEDIFCGFGSHDMPFAFKMLVQVQLSAESHPITGRVKALIAGALGVLTAISQMVVVIMLSVFIVFKAAMTKPMTIIGPWMPKTAYVDEQTYITNTKNMYELFKNDCIDLGVKLATPLLGLAKTVNPNFFSDLTNQITYIYLARTDGNNNVFENKPLEIIEPTVDESCSNAPPSPDLTFLLMQAPKTEEVTLDPIKITPTIPQKEEEPAPLIPFVQAPSRKDDASSISLTLLKYEEMWRVLKNWPQYKYLTRPVYKFVASRSNTVIGTAASFLAADLIVHQLLPKIAKCIFNTAMEKDLPCNFSWDPGCSLIWLYASLPVMYAKYKREFTQNVAKQGSTYAQV